MKTKILFLFTLLFTALYAAETVATGDGYVLADGKIIPCSEMHTGFFNTKILTPDGSMIKIPNGNIEAYSRNGRHYELLPLLNCSGDTVDQAFMELVAVNRDSKLYRYCTNCNKYDPLTGEIAPLNYNYRYYLKDSSGFRLLDCPVEKQQTLAYFHVKVLSD